MTQQGETTGRDQDSPGAGMLAPDAGSAAADVQRPEPSSPPTSPSQPAEQAPLPAGQDRPLPSPYLQAGESVPEAYLAPPQPGKPPYGSLPSYEPGRRLGGPAQFGQTGYRQQTPTGYGQQGTGGRPTLGAGARSKRDPALAALWERLAASILDWIIILAVPIGIFISPLLRIWRELEAVASSSPDLSSPAAQAALNGITRDPANLSTLLHYWLAVFALALAYYWILHTIWGATVGKRALGMRVVSATDRSRIGARVAAIRAVAFVLAPAVFIMLGSPLNLIGGILWIVDSGLPLFDPRVQCLHDKLAGTVVVRQRWLDQQRARTPSPW